MMKGAVTWDCLAAFEPRNRSDGDFRLLSKRLARPPKPSPSCFTLLAADEFVYHDLALFVTGGIQSVKTVPELGIVPS